MFMSGGPEIGYNRESRPLFDYETFAVSTMYMTTKKMEALTVLVAADNAPEAASLAGQIDRHDGLTVLATAITPAELEEYLKNHPEIGLVVTDVVLGGKDVTHLIADAFKRNPKLEVIIHTAYSDESHVIRAIQAGAAGYLLKGGKEDIVDCIRLLLSGGSPVAPSVARSVLLALRSRPIDLAPLDGANLPPRERKSLSARELDILTLLSKGMNFAEIGGLLNISTHTVTAHVKKLYRKLQVHSRAEAVYEATCMGLLKK